MGKGNKHRRDESISNRRLPSAITTHRTDFGFTNLRTFEDRRSFDFNDVFRPARTFSGVVANTRLRRFPTRRSQVQKKFSGLRPEYSRSFVAFTAPDRVLMCVRRKQRREVMFAKGKTGRRGQKRPKFNWFSRISCGRR